jgi:hypothetical protein
MTMANTLGKWIPHFLTILRKSAPLILILFGGVAHANWVAVGDVEGVTFYVELSKVKKTPEGAIDVWWMNSYAAPQYSKGNTESYRSIVFLSTFDCATEMAMSDGGRIYSGEMATGTMLGAFQGEKAWKDIQPQTVLFALFQMVCSKH